MDLSEGIRTVGFRRWYERKLVESHFYLVTSLLSFIAVLASFERLSAAASSWEGMLRAMVIVGGSLLCLWALNRYITLLGLAQQAAARSVCSRCETYGRLELNPQAVPGRHSAGSGAGPGPVNVRCRTCGHAWIIE